MNDFVNHSQSASTQNGGIRSPLDLDVTPWTPNSTGKLTPARPITPLSFAFMSEEERTAFKFPKSTSQQVSSNVMGEEKKPEEEFSSALTTFPVSIPSRKGDTNSTETSPTFSRKSFKVDDLMLVDDVSDPPMTSGPYIPKAHLGWASFGESIQPPPPPVNRTSAPQMKRKVYVIRPQNRDKSKPYYVGTGKPKKDESTSSRAKAPKIAPTVAPTVEAAATDSDEDVDVVGIDEEDSVSAMDSTRPPDLPPQPSFGSRFAAARSKKDNKPNYESDEDELSTPPQLEPQTSDTSALKRAPSTDFDIEEKVDTEGSRLEKHLVMDEVDSSQLLKTKISSSAIPILPLSKSIMERKKVAIEMTKNAVIKKVNAPKPTFKSFSVAPKSVQIPAYTDSAPVTLYSNLTKPGNFHKDARGRCVRCRDRSPVDMSTFKFVEDTTVVAVRAHLCDQTRVMIARTAIWNREYSKRLGDRAAGTVWQKPDEVTAQMTGFCSATVRRCIDIANLSIVPRCADRIGVSKAELASLKTSFGNEKFFGQPMRTPHVLTQYYAVKAQAAAAQKANANGPPPPLRMGRPPGRVEKDEPIDEEEERRHHPLTYYHPAIHDEQSSSQSTSSAAVAVKPSESSSLTATQNKMPLPSLKKTVLRWTSITTPRILRPPTLRSAAAAAVPKMAVIPVMKKREPPPKKDQTYGPKKRGRPRKVVKQADDPDELPARRSLRWRRKDVTEEVKETVEYLMNKVCSESTPNET
ncbi:hypothetical protein CAEBREN_06353 [Caenorhabditis brenneri]|uniref:Uncharacterized protein n=1 Tax=Caenorhabditis brenneri TaxID=135651 RepID=G0MPI5_CAEBE|nr:hypothetical protein CAEBREN_06353 [Caenorhabditis brenneri]